MQFDKSVNIEKFLVWLEELRARWFFDDICLVMDNLSVHRSKVVLGRIEELGFEHVFTPAYSPDLNPIELVFSQFKGQLKRERFRAIRSEKKIDLKATTQDIWGAFDRSKIINCI